MVYGVPQSRTRLKRLSRSSSSSASEKAELEMGMDLPGATQQVRTPAWDRIRVYMGPEERGLVLWGCPEKGGEPSGGRGQASSPEPGAEGGDLRPNDLSESWLGVCVNPHSPPPPGG